MDDDYSDLEIFDESLIDDEENTAMFDNLTISQIIELTTILLPADFSSDHMELIENWIVQDFQLYNDFKQYEPHQWKLITQFVRCLLLKASLRKFKI